MKHYWKFKLLFIPIGIALFVFIFMSLWNMMVPDLFHGPSLSYWQALGVLALGKMLFSSFRCGGRWGGGCCGGGGWKGGKSFWRARMEEKLSKMTPEEREKAKQKFYEKCCGSDWNKEDEKSC